MFSMNRPSRGLRWSATTTRKNGRLFDPILRSRILVLIVRVSSLAPAALAPGCPRHRRHPGDPRKLPGEPLPATQHRAHHLPRAIEVLEERVDVRGGGARPASDPRAAGPGGDFRGPAPLPPQPQE